LMEKPQINKLAFVATGTWLKIMTSVFTQFSNKWEQVKWFDSKEEALAWLET
jgi:hypothetical protein